MQVLHLSLPTTALVPTTDTGSTKSLPLIQDPQRPRTQCGLSIPLPFHCTGKQGPCPRNSYTTNTSGPQFFSGDRKKQKPQPKNNFGGKTLKGDEECLRSGKWARGMAMGPPGTDCRVNTQILLYNMCKLCMEWGRGRGGHANVLLSSLATESVADLRLGYGPVGSITMFEPRPCFQQAAPSQ